MRVTCEHEADILVTGRGTHGSLVVGPALWRDGWAPGQEDEPAGAVGLLGPTRMKYREAMAAARVVSENLTRHFAGEDERG